MKKLFAILIMLTLSMPVAVFAEPEQSSQPSETMEVIQPEEAAELNKNSEQDVELADTLPSTYKEPYSKKKLAKKFLIAMLCVAGCSIFLYATLSVYNKVRDGIFSSPVIPPEGEKPLETPNDLTEAVKTFIDKTNW